MAYQYIEDKPFPAPRTSYDVICRMLPICLHDIV